MHILDIKQICNSRGFLFNTNFLIHMHLRQFKVAINPSYGINHSSLGNIYTTRMWSEILIVEGILASILWLDHDEDFEDYEVCIQCSLRIFYSMIVLFSIEIMTLSYLLALEKNRRFKDEER